MNLLGHETSPYLRQHRDNPVEWMPWNAAALEKARLENKPILLSIGYAACHWCHVMAHESFEDLATAELMNRHFINIKVDREERPDIDAIYQGALALMGKQGGWPLTMFLTPDGKPFWGGTYFPPQPRYGMPSFQDILKGVAESFANDKEKIDHNVKNIAAALEKINSNQPGQLIRREQLDKISGHFLSLIDAANGGIGGAPKFPNLPVMALLWDGYIRTGNDAYKAAVIHSLTQMCRGGIYDHAGGGFSRYSTDAEWLVPHFEKMLNDNALFIALLAEVYKETRNPLFAQCVEETIGWALEALTVRNLSYSAFASSLDADSDGVEGKYYVWTAQEVEKILGKDAETFKKIYDVTRFGNWEAVNILNRLKNPEYLSATEEAQLKVWREKLKTSRDRRAPPQLDNKILADGNGLMIKALACAGFAFDRAQWIEAAESAFRFVTAYMMEKDGRLYHSWCDGKAAHAALLEDYANMAEAALTLHEITQNAVYLTQAVSWIKILNTSYHDPAQGGYFMSSDDASDMLLRPKSAHDGAAPSGNGTMVGVLTRLYHLTGEENYLALAENTAGAFAGEVMHQPFPFATLLRNSDFFMNPVSVVIIEKSQDSAAFHQVLRHISLPFLIKITLPAGSILPKNHPAFGKEAIEQKTTAYACFGQQCQPPVSRPEALEQLLRQERFKQSQTVSAANDG